MREYRYRLIAFDIPFMIQRRSGRFRGGGERCAALSAFHSERQVWHRTWHSRTMR